MQQSPTSQRPSLQPILPLHALPPIPRAILIPPRQEHSPTWIEPSLMDKVPMPAPSPRHLQGEVLPMTCRSIANRWSPLSTEPETCLGVGRGRGVSAACKLINKVKV